MPRETVPPPTKFAIISRKIDEACFEIKLYLVDVDDSTKEHLHIDPALQFRFPLRDFDAPAVCFLNSTLYMFDGHCIPACNPTSPDYNRRIAYKSVCSPQELQLKQDLWLPTSLCPMSPTMNPMKHVKALPEATPTPDGKKVLVFSTLFMFKDSGKAFELFNPDNESWETLPALPCTNCCKLDSYTGPRGFGAWCFCTEDDYFVKVSCYSFVGKSVFYIEIGLGAFSLDLKKKKKEWVSVGIPIVPSVSYGVRYFQTAMGRYVIILGSEPHYGDDDYVLLTYGDCGPILTVYDIGKDGFCCKRDAADRDKYEIEYLDPLLVIPLSPFGPPPDSLWLEPASPIIIFPLLPIQKESESNTCFAVQELEGIKPDEEIDDDDDLVGETRFLIEVCRTDSHHKHTVSKVVSFTTRFSESLGSVFFFTR